jgi:hypothetical protein
MTSLVSDQPKDINSPDHWISLLGQLKFQRKIESLKKNKKNNKRRSFEHETPREWITLKMFIS